MPTVSPITVLPQTLSVIGCKESDHLAGWNKIRGVLEKPRDVVVDIGDLGIVLAAVRIEIAIGSGSQLTQECPLQLVGSMGLDIVDPEEEGPLGLILELAGEPLGRPVGEVLSHRFSLDHPEPAGFGHNLLVLVELPGHPPELVAQGPIAHKGGALVAMMTQDLGNRKEIGAHPHAVASRAVLLGRKRGEHRGQGGSGERLHGARLGEADTLPQKSVEVR